MLTFVLLLALFGVLLALFGGALMLLGRAIVRGNGADQFVAFVLVGLVIIGVFASPALATGHGQAVIVQEYIAAPQAVVVPYAVQQQNAACVVQQFNAYAVPIQRQQFVQQKFVQQNFKQQSFQRSRSRQQFNSGGNFRSFSIQSQSSGRRGLLGIF